jgi:hypothetical protein
MTGAQAKYDARGRKSLDLVTEATVAVTLLGSAL